MTKHNYRECDICGETIGHAMHLRLKRFFIHGWIVRLLNWGIVDLAPVDSGWQRGHVDLCKGCWVEVKGEIAERVAPKE